MWFLLADGVVLSLVRINRVARLVVGTEVRRVDKELHLSEEVCDDVDVVEEGEQRHQHHHAVPQQH